MQGKISEYTVQNDIINRFIDSFVQSDFCFFDKSKSRNLLWCFFREESDRVFPTVELNNIKLPSGKEVYFYNARTEELHKTDFCEICEFVNCLEPWVGIDAEIFDETMDWVIAITHEDFSMVLGLAGN